MTFLAIDTSGDYGVVALGNLDGTLKAVSVFEGRRSLSRRLIGVVDRLLEDNGFGLGDLSGLAVGIGPGSFTGLRVGLTTMKTFAQVTGLPLVGVNTLDAHAYGLSAETVIVALPSRRGEVYAAIYPGRRAPFAETVPAMAERCRDLNARGRVLICGDRKTLEELAVPEIPSVERSWTPAEGLTQLAAARFASGVLDDPMSLVPSYVVPPAISTPRNSSILPSP